MVARLRGLGSTFGYQQYRAATVELGFSKAYVVTFVVHTAGRARFVLLDRLRPGRAQHPPRQRQAHKHPTAAEDVDPWELRLALGHYVCSEGHPGRSPRRVSSEVRSCAPAEVLDRARVVGEHRICFRQVHTVWTN